MPPKKGGKKGKRTKRGSNNEETTRFVPIADPAEGQMYALASKMLGNRRLTAKCADGKERLALIPGKFKGRRNWVSVGTLLMLNIRSYQDGDGDSKAKADVIYIYAPQDAKRLQRKGELATLIDEEKEDTDGFVFGIEGDDLDAGTDSVPQQQPASTTADSSDSESDGEELNLDDL